MASSPTVAPYTSSDHEGRPRLAIYHPSFAKAEKLVTKVCDDFAREFVEAKDQGLEEEGIKNICTTDLDRYRYPHRIYPSVLPVAMLGLSLIHI